MTPATWTYLVTGTCFLLAIFLVWQELRRANRARLVVRIVAVLIATVMLACLALPVSYRSNTRDASLYKINLLTEGFNTDSIPSDAKVFTMDKSDKRSYPKAVFLSSVDKLLDTLKTQQLHIYGNGLTSSQLAQLNQVRVVFHPSKPISGVTNISWNARLKAGEALRVQGSYLNTSAQKAKLILKGLNTILDAVSVKSNTTFNFDLTTTPKAIGRMVYTLQTVVGTDTITQGDIPVQIDMVKPLRVLMLAASPDFETKFLKNWLAEKGYAVAARSAISKNKFNTEFINIAEQPLERLSTTTLSKFDVVLGDLSVLNNLSAAESAALKQTVADKGLGIIISADSSGKSSWLQSAFPVTRLVTKETTSALLILGKKSISAKLNNGPIFISYKNGTQPLVTNPKNQISANSSLLGEGKLVFSTLGNTHTWVLSGNRADYDSYWSALLGKAAQKDSAINMEVEIPSIPYTGQPLQLNVTQGAASFIRINGQSTAPMQNPAVPFEWNLPYWPSEKGWQAIRQNNSVNWWYNYDVQDWKGIRASARIAATKKYVQQQPVFSSVTKQIQQIVRIEVPKIYFYILLLAACTFLWIESKLS